MLSNGTYYPAAIYLGGATQTDVRAIDSSVIALFDQAETNGETGTNNTGGGHHGGQHHPVGQHPFARFVAGDPRARGGQRRDLEPGRDQPCQR